MKIEANDIQDLRPLIHAAVRATLDEIASAHSKLGDRLGFPEAEAAALIGVPKHVLRDARLRGEISGRLCGKRIVYSRSSLLHFLEGQEGARNQ